MRTATVSLMAKSWFNRVRATALVALLLPVMAQAQSRTPPGSAQTEMAAQLISTSDATPSSGRPLLPGQPIPAAQLEAFVDGVVRDAMAAEHIAGVSVAIVQGGRPALLKGYGLSHLDPVRAVDPHRTLFRLASMSKSFTWVLLMKEVERGRIKLDAPVNEYLPDELHIADQGYDRPVRVIDLLSHTTGFDSLDLASHPAANSGDTILEPYQYLVRQQPPRVREAGTLATYSNYAVALAGYIVARLNGVDYNTLLERELLGPLKMQRTSFREPYAARPDLPAPMSEALARDLSAGFFWNGNDFEVTGEGVLTEFLTTIGPAGSGSATAADMARYMLMQLNGGSLDGVTIYGPQVAQALRSQILDVPEGINGWAHGFMRMSLPGGYHGYGHGGSGEAFKGYFNVVHELDLGVYLGVNTPTGWSLALRLPSLIVEHFYAPAPSELRAAGDPTLVQEASRYEGHYALTRRAHTGYLQFVDALTSGVTIAVTPEGYLLTKVGALGFGSGGGAWVPDGEPGKFRAVQGEGRLTFAFGPDGRATSYPDALGTATIERVTTAFNPRLFNAALFLALVAVACAALGAVARWGKPMPATPLQVWSGRLPLVIGVLWIVCTVALFMALADPDLLYRWPGPALRVAGIAATLAFVSSLALLVLLPAVWRRSPVASHDWSVGRKARHTAIVVLLLPVAVLVALRGGIGLP